MAMHYANLAVFLCLIPCLAFLAYTLARDSAMFALGLAILVGAIGTTFRVDTNTPADNLLACFVMLAAAILEKIRISRSQKWYPLIGLVLGFGCLTKSVFLPVSLLVIAMLPFVGGRSRRTLMGALLSAATLGIIVAPYVLAVSAKVGRLSFGESGRLNYMFYVDRVQPSVVPRQPGLHHPPRILLETPEIQDLSAHPAGTFPDWFDPSYWYDGIEIHFSPLRQLKRFSVNMMVTAIVAVSVIGPGLILLLCIPAGWRGRLESWPSAALGGFLCSLYMPVNVEERYLGSALLVLVLCGAKAINFPSVQFRNIMIASISLVSVISQIPVQFESVRFARERSKVVGYDRYEGIPAALATQGLVRGARVACIGFVACHEHWAHAAGVRVVGMVRYPYLSDDFFSAPDEKQLDILSKLASTGASAVVIAAEGRPSKLVIGWTPIGGNLFLKKLDSRAH